MPTRAWSSSSRRASSTATRASATSCATRDGTPVLIDLDGFAIGPREWDLVLTAMYYDSFGWHTREEYEDFARVYGYDIRQWPGYPVLREVREFLMVTWVIQKAAAAKKAAAEAAKRITALRTGASRDWTG